MKKILSRIVPAFALWALMFGSQAAAGTKYCYSAALYDRDADGYADLRGAAADDPRFAAADQDAMLCPAGFVDKSGDCNDANASVHPRRSELGYNGVDDNCNGAIDEPTVYYAAAGVMNTISSFRMLVYLNHASVRASAIAGTLYADITYAKLSDANNETVISKRAVNSFGDSFAYARVDLSGLLSGKVYRARVQFFRRNATGTYTAVGPISPWYYTMTDSLTAKVHTRFQIVLKALKEKDDSDSGLVGYRGTTRIDGTRYGAVAGEKWCSEFYSWATQDWLNGIAGRSSTGRLREYFEGYDSFYAASEIPARAAPGDYLYLDTNEDGTVNHSGMFLAYDTSTIPARVWSIEGNVSDTVAVKARNADWGTVTPVFLRLGYITTAMLD